MQKSRSNNQYFGADKAEDLVSYLNKKGQTWYGNLSTSKYLDKLKKSWLSYHGNFYENSHEVSYGGEVGELVNLPVNHYKNIANNIITMITATRPAFQAKSINTDYESQVQTKLANGLLEYYLREKRLEKHLKTAVEYAVVMGAGYVKMEWDASEGEIYDYIDIDESTVAGYDSEGDPVDENGKKIAAFPVYEGDVKFSTLSPFDVVFDSTKEDSMQHDWVLIRTFKNKYDLIAKYPELEEEILQIPTKSDRSRYRVALNALDETVDVPVYEFFHKRSPALPNGRYVLYLSEDCILMDTAMPYRRLPIYRISAGEMLGTPYAYTAMFDLLPLQDAVNSLFSTVLTNQNAFGVQNILNPRGNDIRVNQVEGGLNFIEYNPVVAGGGDGTPKPLNLTQTPAEIFNFMQILIQQMEIISGVNSVVRGAPEKNLRSGSSLAMVQSQALQFMSGLQQSYIMSIEDVGTGLVELLQDFATVPRIAQISGISNKPKMEEFSGKDLEGITRVIVDVGNALSQTTAGRLQMADGMMQMGLIKTPEDYFSVINSGRLDVLTENQDDENLLVRAENERLVSGETQVIASQIDQHAYHIKKHRSVIADPDLRLDAELVDRVVAHIQEHIEMLRTTGPALLAILGEQSLGPVAGSPPNTMMPPNMAQPDQGMAMPMAMPEAQTTAPMNLAGFPNEPVAMPEESQMPPQGQPIGRPLGG
jgi:hypothetical protein